MWECHFANEPVDFKLLWLKFFKNIGWFFAGIAIGALLVGGGLFLNKAVFASAKEYKVVAELYLDYAMAEGQNLSHVSFNEAAWISFAHTDEMVNDIVEILAAEGITVTAKEVRESIEAALPSDTRIIESTVITSDPQLSVSMSRAFQEAIVRFCERRPEFAGTRILTSPDEATKVLLDMQILKAVIFGAVLGGFLTLMVMLLYVTLDDSVYIPASLERRYGLPILGTINDRELAANFAHLLRGCMRIAIVGAHKDIPTEEIAELLNERLQKFGEAFLQAGDYRSLPTLFGVGSMEEKVENAEGLKELNELREADGMIFVADSGRHDGKQIEKSLSFLQRQGLPVRCGLLWNADERLLKHYYGLGFGFFKGGGHEG